MEERRPHGDGTPAQRYERLYPGTGISDAHKQERMERIDFKEERKQLKRTSRNRSFVVPALPWHDDE